MGRKKHFKIKVNERERKKKKTEVTANDIYWHKDDENKSVALVPCLFSKRNAL